MVVRISCFDSYTGMDFTKEKRFVVVLLILIQGFFIYPQLKLSKAAFFDSLIREQLKNYPEIKVNPAKYRLQIIYTRINRDKKNVPSFTHFGYRAVNPNYFYCASLVKLPCSILALEKVNQLKEYGVDMNSPLLIDSVNSCQRKWYLDGTSENGLPSVAQYIRRMLLVSDNHSYSRIYEFLTNNYFHSRMKELGFPKARLVVRFDGLCSGENHFVSNPFYFIDLNGKVIYEKESTHSKNVLPVSNKPLIVGKAMLDSEGKKLKRGKDFSKTNYLELMDVHQVLKNLIFLPYLPVGKKKYNLSGVQRDFLLEHLGMWPRESRFPKYDSVEYKDSHKKYLIYGAAESRIHEDSIRIFNIVGQAYGFVSDCAYIVDQENGLEFMLSAVLYTNQDGIINDGVYECQSLGLPFLEDLGKLFYSYEKKRAKKNKADLSEFNFDFKN